jgi:hypothetical protein
MMIEALKALVVALTMAIGAFIYARMAFSDVVSPSIIDRYRNIFIATTIAAFALPNFWLMMFTIAAIALLMGAVEKFKPPIFLLLVFAAPAADAYVPGIGPIQNFLSLSPYNVLVLVLLWPLLLRANENRAQVKIGAIADYCFILFALVSVALAFRETSATNGIRRATAFLLTSLGPYLVFSRMMWTKERLKVATLAYVAPMIALSGVGVAEVVLNWHIYKVAVDNWDIYFFARYLAREGFLRAYGSVFGPITFGLFLTVAVALLPALIHSASKKFLPRLGFLALAGGLVSTFSRGPWIGALLTVVVHAATAEKPIVKLARLGALGVVAFAGLALTPMGGSLIAMLPFVGDVETNNIDYRARLLEVGIRVVQQNPLFGSENYKNSEAMQSLVQGQGIVDIVNAYLQVALDKGLVGLSLFLGVTGVALWSAFRAIPRARAFDEELAVYVQAWFAALVGVMLVLATTTNVVAQISEVHWLLCGMCVGIARSVAAASVLRPAAVQSVAAAPAEPAPPIRPPVWSKPAPPAKELPPHLRQYARKPESEG